jgi:hypothetical protein
VDEQRTTVVLAHGCSSPPPLPIYLPNPRDGFETAHAPVLLPAHSGTMATEWVIFGYTRLLVSYREVPELARGCAKRMSEWLQRD